MNQCSDELYIFKEMQFYYFLVPLLNQSLNFLKDLKKWETQLNPVQTSNRAQALSKETGGR